MTQLLTLLFALNLIFPGAPGQNIESKAELLTGGSQKTWYLTGRSPDGNNSCSSSSPHFQDNNWTFFIDGSLEYNHGQLTEDPGCEDKDCCSDLVNLTGKWELTNNGAGLRITALHEKGNPENAFSLILFDAALEQLESGRFVMAQNDPETGVKHTFTFDAR